MHGHFIWNILVEAENLQVRSQNGEKRPFASSCLSAWNSSAYTGRIFVQLDEYFSKICRENLILIKISLEQRILYGRPTYIYDKIWLISP
jgi:hypothetical protein